MVLPKPTSKSNWTLGNPNFVNVTVEPGVAKKQAGWEPDERPPAEFLNWLEFNNDEWIKYLESKTDAQFLAYGVVIGNTGTNPAATHDTLQDAIDDGALGSNQSVLITEGQVINTTIDLNKSGWRIRCLPGIVFSKGGTTTGISINADAVEWLDGRVVGFTTGGDKAVNFTASGTYGKVIGSRFAAGTDTEIDDTSAPAGKKPVIAMTISE